MNNIDIHAKQKLANKEKQKRLERRVARKRKRRCFWSRPFGHKWIELEKDEKDKFIVLWPTSQCVGCQTMKCNTLL